VPPPPHTRWQGDVFRGNYCHQVELSFTDVLFRTLRRIFASVFWFPTLQNEDRCRATSFCNILSYCHYTSETLPNLFCARHCHASKRDCRSCHNMWKHLLTDILSLTFDDEISRKIPQISRYSDKATYSTTEVRFSALGRFFSLAHRPQTFECKQSGFFYRFQNE